MNEKEINAKFKLYEGRISILEKKNKNNWREREEDDKYWSGVVKEKDKEIKLLKKNLAKWKRFRGEKDPLDEIFVKKHKSPKPPPLTEIQEKKK